MDRSESRRKGELVTVSSETVGDSVSETFPLKAKLSSEVSDGYARIEAPETCLFSDGSGDCIARDGLDNLVLL